MNTKRYDLAVVWFRHDLRLNDNPAWWAACQLANRVLPVYVYAPAEEGDWPYGGASRWWLSQSLQALNRQLKDNGGQLYVLRPDLLEAEADTAQLLEQVCLQTGAEAMFFNRRYEPAAKQQEAAVSGRLLGRLACLKGFDGNVLFPPDAIQNQQGKPFQVFSAYWRHVRSLGNPMAAMACPTTIPGFFRLEEVFSTLPDFEAAWALLGLEPDIARQGDWPAGFRVAGWQPGELGGQRFLQVFGQQTLSQYATGRDQPAIAGTSRLSPYLCFGQVSPRQIWHALGGPATPAAEAYCRQLVWREFAHHLLVAFPETPKQPLRPAYQHFPFEPNGSYLKAWQRGQTGYPLVDAGMRELWTTGWMHNRVRMVVASFLVKHLLQPWQAGARWFWDTLLDADLANNTMGWQWVAGCGADAAPYFRIFNPMLQGQKFDPDGAYVRRWLPELSALPTAFIHQPWQAPPLILHEARIRLGETYPEPIVYHEAARQKALAALAKLKHPSVLN